jgi:hypothetical protein
MILQPEWFANAHLADDFPATFGTSMSQVQILSPRP